MSCSASIERVPPISKFVGRIKNTRITAMPGLNFKGTNKYQKIAESMLKKTHFTESEIDRLSDLHANILVKIIFGV